MSSANSNSPSMTWRSRRAAARVREQPLVVARARFVEADANFERTSTLTRFARVDACMCSSASNRRRRARGARPRSRASPCDLSSTMNSTPSSPFNKECSVLPTIQVSACSATHPGSRARPAPCGRCRRWPRGERCTATRGLAEGQRHAGVHGVGADGHRTRSPLGAQDGGGSAASVGRTPPSPTSRDCAAGRCRGLWRARRDRRAAAAGCSAASRRARARTSAPR